MSHELKKFPILVVDDEPDNLDAFRFNFRDSFCLVCADSGARALELLDRQDVAVIVSDQRMPKMSGLELLRKAHDIRPDAIGIILTAFTDVDVLIQAINHGHIYRYITKPWDAQELRGVLTQALERFHLRRENQQLTKRLKQYSGYLHNEMHGAYDFGNIIGNSDVLAQVLSKVEQVAPTTSTVLLRGETGTGKELIARAVHINSFRENNPFVRVNCAALAPGILESELFGHEKGAFAGALNTRPGRFELANSGTLFLDEVGDLPMEVQIRLVRTLQERAFERVGGTETIPVDVRVISATKRNLEAMIEQGTFREDLYFRLNVFPINLPPLRERLSDIPPLVDHFIAKFSRSVSSHVRACSTASIAKLQSYSWPGNVRELENTIERALILAASSTIEAEDLSFGRSQIGNDTIATNVTSGNPTDTGTPRLAERLLQEEKREIVAAVERTNGNIASAARMLGINRSTLYYRMRKHGLEHLLPTKVAVHPQATTDKNTPETTTK